MLNAAVDFAIAVFISSCSLYVASHLIALKGELKEFLYVVLAGSVMTLVPYAGWLLSFIVVVYLLIQLLDCSIIDSIWVAVVASMLRLLVQIGLY